jgi:hypothetical protein
MVNLHQIYRDCLAAIGGTSNSDIRWYLEERPKRITRRAFFREASWAICVTGISRKAATSFFERAKTFGPIQDYIVLSSWDPARFRRFMERVHQRPVPPRARAKWTAIYTLAKILAGYSSEQAFREEFFGGKRMSAALDDNDVARLTRMRLSFIAETNAHFIIRNMGGEAIKCDRWILAFLRRYRTTLKQLSSQLHALSIPLGLFDIAVWAYCEKHVRSSRNFSRHFGPLGLITPTGRPTTLASSVA